MLKCYNFDIVCQEIPEEVTLALNISGCPNKCKGCHSPWLWKDEGVPLDEHFLHLLIDKYSDDITCVCFMGGDQEVETINSLAALVKQCGTKIKVGWYSGLEEIPSQIDLRNFDFIKVGPYIEENGGLRSATTNQRLYKVEKDLSLHHIKFSPKNG